MTTVQKADLIIFALHTTGQMKTLLDHLAFQYMIHRPNKTMFTKTALVISTAVGYGMKSTIKDITDSLEFWGVGKIFTYGKAVQALTWSSMNKNNKIMLRKDMKAMAIKVRNTVNKVKPSLKVRFLFYSMRFMHKMITITPIDKQHWKEQGWLEKTRPWISS